MEYSFTMNYNEKQILEYEKKMLMYGGCDFFIPMSFVKEGATEMVHYDCSGYVPISVCEKINVFEMLTWLEEILKDLVLSTEYMIKPTKICVSCETVFVSSDNKNIKLAYIPTEEEKTIGERIRCITGELLEKCNTREQKMYLEKLCVCLEKNMKLSDILSQIGQYKREVHLCGFS